MIDKLIMVIHVLLLLFLALYALIIKNTKYDYIYLTFIYIILLHWILLNGECIISYFFKKIKNNNYSLGDNFRNDDFYYLFGKNKNNILMIYNIMLLLNIYIVCNRNNINNYFIYIFIMLYIYYVIYFSYLTGNHINKKFIFIYYIYNIILILFGLYMYSNIYNINE
jgi:hypothetical protein